MIKYYANLEKDIEYVSYFEKNYILYIEMLLSQVSNKEENKKNSQRTFYLTVFCIIALFSLFGAYKDFKEVFGIKSSNNKLDNKI